MRSCRHSLVQFVVVCNWDFNHAIYFHCDEIENYVEKMVWQNLIKRQQVSASAGYIHFSDSYCLPFALAVYLPGI